MTYSVTIRFGGYYGAEKTYEVDTYSREEAELLALQEAQEDLEAIDVELEEEDD